MDPASEFPPGYLDEYTGNVIIISQAIFITVMIITISLRFYAKALVKSKLGIDDWLMIPSGICGIAASVCTVAMVNYGGAGYHIQAVLLREPEVLVTYGKLIVAYATFYVTGMNLPKISMLCMELRIFVDPWQRKACYILIGILIATSIGDVIADWNLCTPLAFFWDNTIPGGHCIDIVAYWRWGTLPNIITDVFMLLLPIPAIFKIQLSKKDKAGLLLTFIVGGSGLITSILRFHSFWTFVGAGPGSDATWDVTPEAVYSILEVTVYIICACLPSYRGFYIYMRRRNGTSNKTPIRSRLTQQAWQKHDSERDSRSDDYQVPLHQFHSTAVGLDDENEKSSSAVGISVRSEYEVTRASR